MDVKGCVSVCAHSAFCAFCMSMWHFLVRRNVYLV